MNFTEIFPKCSIVWKTPTARFVLTIHSKPKAVLIGAEAFLEILRGPALKTDSWPYNLVLSFKGSNPPALRRKRPTSQSIGESWSESDPCSLGSIRRPYPDRPAC